MYISYLTLTFNCENTYYYHYYVHGLYLSECPQNLLQFLRFRSIRNLHSIFFVYKEFILHANGTATLKLAKFQEYILGINPSEAEILKRILKNAILCVETAFVHYNYMILTKPYKILPFSKRQNYKTMNSYTSQMFDTSDSIQTLRYRSHCK